MAEDHDPAQEMVSPWMMVQRKGFFEVKPRLEKAVNKGEVVRVFSEKPYQ